MISKKVKIGPENELKDLPKELKLSGSNYILTKGPFGYELLSSICPHARGKVNIAKKCLECSLRWWEFYEITGESIDVPDQN